LAQVDYARQVEMAGQAGVEVFDVSLDLLGRLTPGWLARGLTPLEDAVRFGRDLGVICPSTRHRSEVPWIDPRWVVPPPPEAMQPRAQYQRRSSKAKGERKVIHTAQQDSNGPCVRLKHDAMQPGERRCCSSGIARRTTPSGHRRLR
jgi:hypothetical protein